MILIANLLLKLKKNSFSIGEMKQHPLPCEMLDVAQNLFQFCSQKTSFFFFLIIVIFEGKSTKINHILKPNDVFLRKREKQDHSMKQILSQPLPGTYRDIQS